MNFINSWSEEITWSRPHPKETIFLIMRHGEVDGNDPSKESAYIMTGSRTNPSLNQKGILQAKNMADQLYSLQTSGLIKISGIYSSPLKRANETSKYLSQKLQLSIEERSNLQEIDWGDADGIPVKIKHEKWGEAEKLITTQITDRKLLWDLLPPIPNAEKYNQVLKRVFSELLLISQSHKGEAVLITTHGRVIKTLLIHASDIHEKNIPYAKNCDVAVFRICEGILSFIEIRTCKKC